MSAYIDFVVVWTNVGDCLCGDMSSVGSLVPKGPPAERMHQIAIHHIQEPATPVDSPAGTSIDRQHNLDKASQLRLKILAEVLSLKVACCLEGPQALSTQGC